MNAVIDAGNTTIKLGIFNNDVLLEKHSFGTIDELHKFFSKIEVDNVIVSSVSENPIEVLLSINVKGKKIILTPELTLPIANLYSTPRSLGVDRIAAACGAWLMYPNQTSLVIDVGTCLNYEFVNNKGEYLGGAISPGVTMRFESMHSFTAKLPIALPLENARLIGNSTISCLQSGVMNGMLEEINGMIRRHKIMDTSSKIILCGGDCHYFEHHLESEVIVIPEIVLTGLNSILLNNIN